MKEYLHKSILILVILGSLMVIMSFDPISQTQAYHDFADKRSFFDIPNFFDLTTNIFFILIGFIGLNYCFRKNQKNASWSWISFFSGVALSGIGSAYYHLNPNNDTLFWDRLPMTMVFMGIFIVILNEYVNPKIERYFLIPAILLGIFSIIYWHYIDDLRFYIWVQLMALLIFPIVLTMFKSNYSHQRYFGYGLIFYLFAKITEIFDKEIFDISHDLVSGHSLKHILASLGPFFLYLMLKKRELIKVKTVHESE